MRIIDFHTHTFPDEIAEQSISYLEKKGHIKAVTNAKRSTLVRSMRESGVVRSRSAFSGAGIP